MKLLDKVALVTGAGRGLGKAIAVALAREGADVAVNDLDAQLAEEVSGRIVAMGRRAIPITADVSRSAEVINMIKRTIGVFGRIDILVNNAGIFSSVPLDSMTEAEWDKVLEINLKGVFLCSQGVIMSMKKQRFGRIVNIASMAGKVGGITAGANYAASKAGVISLTKSLAKQLAPYGITANAVAPGLIETPMTKAFPQEEWELLLKQIPLGRVGKPEDVAETVLFLVSDGANYITGEIIDVNGGLLID